MNRHLPVVLACCAIAPLSACGSSSSGPSTTAKSSTVPAGAGGASGAIKADTTPKFASPSRSEPARTGVVRIAYRNIAIFPDTVRVKLGSTIRWTNYDSTQANVVSEGGPLKFASKNFGKGATYELKATKAGVIHYECTLYPATMNGTIEVVA